MANTLKFGNGEWYGKEGSILAYNDEGGNYKPIPVSSSRSSTGTIVNKEGLIETVGLNQPRVDYKDSSEGALLLEVQSTNLLKYSEDFSQSYWINTGSYDVVYENKLNPKGELGYYKLTGTTGLHQLKTNIIAVGSSVNDFTLSILVKNIDSDSIRLDLSDAFSGDAYIDFFFATETFGTAVNGGSWTNAKGSFIKLKNGWYYVSLTATKNAGNNIIPKIIYSNDSVDLFAAQVEQQSYATSYIPNYGTAAGVTRSSDNLGSTVDLAAANIINTTEGVYFTEIKIPVSDSRIASTGGLILGSDNSFPSPNSIELAMNTDGSLRVAKRSGGTFTALGNVSNGVYHKIAVSWNSLNSTVYIDGSQFTTTTFANTDFKYIYLNGGDSTKMIKTIKVYDEALSDAELTKLTTL